MDRRGEPVRGDARLGFHHRAHHLCHCDVGRGQAIEQIDRRRHHRIDFAMLHAGVGKRHADRRQYHFRDRARVLGKRTRFADPYDEDRPAITVRRIHFAHPCGSKPEVRAMISRIISLVPAPMVKASASR